MKTLGKLSLNPENIIKNDELVNLRGGYEGPPCCYCAGHGFMLLIDNASECSYECLNAYGVFGFWLC
jgi:natural product precursor